MTSDDRDDIAYLRELITGYETSQVIYVAATLGLPAILARGPETAAHVARAVGADVAAFTRLLRVLVALGLVEARADGTFALAPAGHRLVPDSPSSLHALALLAGARSYRVWGELLHSVTTGGTGFERAFGMSTFQYMTSNPALAEVYDRAMSASSAEIVAAVLEVYNFFRAAAVVDVGGGLGHLLLALLTRHSALRGVLLDRPPVAERARPAFEAAGLASRCRVVAGDFFAAVPDGGDVYVLSHVIHNWDDARALTILRNCRAAMGDGARLLIVEKVLPDTLEASPAHRRAAMADIHMLVVTGGRERTIGEYRRLLVDSDLHVERVIATGVPESIIEIGAGPPPSPPVSP